MDKVFAILLALLISSSFATETSLYSEDDPLWELDSSNFDEIVFGKNNAWIIEFYNNWCGHCIRFAPVWKQFARDTKTWKNVVDVGVVNCNDNQNIKLCREYGVQGFPTIKLFWHHTNKSEHGDSYLGPRNISGIEDGIIDFLEAHWNEGVPSIWPNIHPTVKETVGDIIDTIPGATQTSFLFIEPTYSYIGRKVILDLAFKNSIQIQRALTNNTRLMNELNLSNASVPAFVALDRHTKPLPVIRFSPDANTSYIRDQIFEHIVKIPREDKDKTTSADKITNNITAVQEAVYMTDLENALYNSLYKEVGVSRSIEGEKLSALKAYLSVLRMYFPGKPHIMAYLSKLHSWLSYRMHSLTGEDFVRGMEQLQNEDAYLPKMRGWVGCKGSDPKFRGYPCSLWTLFHTLTVHSFEDVETKNAHVLFIIRDYIKHFFTCEGCKIHFLEMSENVERDVDIPQDAVLWLWEAHNQVNQRLAGDATEDPQHPKIQFPSPQMCPKCRSLSTHTGVIVWDKGQVLQFLRKFYSKNILDTEPERVHAVPEVNNLSTDLHLLKIASHVYR